MIPANIPTHRLDVGIKPYELHDEEVTMSESERVLANCKMKNEFKATERNENEQHQWHTAQIALT